MTADESTGKIERSDRAMTMADVARRAGVSTATVSRALNSPNTVARSTQSHVTRVIEEIGYTPNLTARNLRVQSTRLVLALVPGLINSFFSPILSAIEDELSSAGYGLIIGDTRQHMRQHKDREVHYARLLGSRQVDGAIVMTGRLPRSADGRSIGASLPIVLVCNGIRGAGLPLFAVDNRKAASIMTKYLIDMGHRRIGFIGGPVDDATDARERSRGFLEAMAAAGLATPPHFLWQGNFLPDSGAKAAEGFLALGHRPTAVFAANDESAIGFIRALSSAGVSVPRDVSVVGFDDVEQLGLFVPGLTTMRQPRTELGRLAAQDLLRRMGHQTHSGVSRIRLECELIVRDSVRRLEV